MSTSLTTKNIYKEYEKQLASLPGPTSYATIIAGYRKNTTIAPSILKTPFYAGVVEIGLFADELIKLADSAMSIAEITADLADFLSTVPNVPNIFIPKTFDIDLIIDSVEFSFSITEKALVIKLSAIPTLNFAKVFELQGRIIILSTLNEPDAKEAPMFLSLKSVIFS